jgi:acyl dehydratase
MPTKALSELQSMVGESIVTAEGLRVEAGKVEEFARAITDGSPVYRDPAVARRRGLDAVPAPVTFTRTAEFPRYRTAEFVGKFGFDLGFDSQTTLHGSQSYEFTRPVVVGDVLTGTATLLDVYQREGRRGGPMTFAVIHEVFEDQAGEPVVTVESTYIETRGGDA